MDDQLIISFPNPINTLVLGVSDKDNLTCESVILNCLRHLQEEMNLTAAQRETDIGISPYVPAFGLYIASREKKTYVPLHYKFDLHKHHKEYRFCVRHIPPCPEKENLPKIPLYNLVWQLFILQGIEDFLWTKHRCNETRLTEDVIMDLATLALIISFSDLPNDHHKKIDESFNYPNFNLFNYRRHFSKAFIKRLTKSGCIPNWIFDYVDLHSKFKQWISHFKSEMKFLGTYKVEFIFNFLFYHPYYGIEFYDVQRREYNGTLEKCTVEIKMSQRGKNQQLGLYLNKQNACSLAKIQQVIIIKHKDHPVTDPENIGHEIVIATESLDQRFRLVFKDREELDSFVSLLQGTVFLYIQPSLYLNKQFMPQSSIIKERLQSFWSMRHAEASNLLSSSNMWKPEEERRKFLLYQDRDNLYNFTIATEDRNNVKNGVHWSPKDNFTIYKNEQPLMSFPGAENVLEQFRSEYGNQLYPKLISKEQNVHPNSIYYLNLPECGENEGGGGPDEAKDVTKSRGYIVEKDISPRFKLEIANEYDDLKRFKVMINGEDKLLVELQSRHPKAKEAIIKNVMKMIELWEVSPKSILNFEQQAFVSSLKESFVYEYPTHGTLSMFLYANKDQLSWLQKLKICLQVVSVIYTIQTKGLFHGNIRTSNFYVFVNDNADIVVKLGDPGLVYMYDDPGAEFQYLNKRSPWMAPERLENPQCINEDTECYAVGTTLSEILHATDDFRKLLKLRTDENVIDFFREGKKIPPPVFLHSEDDPKALMPEIRKIMGEAWETVNACWNEDPNERPSARDLACKFRELTHSASELPFERLMDYLRPILSNCTGAEGITPKNFRALVKKQSSFYIEPEQVILTDEKLGKGYYGEVKKCHILRQKITGNMVETEKSPVRAAKTLFESTNNASMIKEIDLIATLNHENVVKFLHFTFKEDKTVLIMEYLEAGSLLHFVRSLSEKPDKDTRKLQYFKTLLKLAHDVAVGMKYIHSQNIIHCDLAARNVLLHKDTQHTVTRFVAKVGDFGLAKILNPEQNYYRVRGSVKLPVCWTPPEYFNRDETGVTLEYKGDVWSYGVLLWEMFTLGRSPNKDFPRDDILLFKLQQGWRLEEEYLQFDDNRVYKDLMMKCWELDPLQRPSFSDLSSIIEDFRLSLENNLSLA